MKVAWWHLKKNEKIKMKEERDLRPWSAAVRTAVTDAGSAVNLPTPEIIILWAKPLDFISAAADDSKNGDLVSRRRSTCFTVSSVSRFSKFYAALWIVFSCGWYAAEAPHSFRFLRSADQCFLPTAEWTAGGIVIACSVADINVLPNY